MQQLKVIDSHTGGEPTRLIVDGGPDLGTGYMRDRLNRFRDEFAFDRDYWASMFRCHRSIGRAIYYTSITIMLGFSILVFAINKNPGAPGSYRG